ncbi:hypothetical protein [Dactylosporangium sp. CS-033363]|uniref:hypothetical protein n=1 Tax=Dactylosporangium sp. CS-033363 TaxID=3239935 RepID=UPI003D8BD3EE
MQTVYEAAGGEAGLLRHTERLAAYWAEALAGPAVYTQRHGDETSVVRMHSGNSLHEGDGPQGDRMLR